MSFIFPTTVHFSANADAHLLRPRYYVPKNPYQTPGYYPQEPFSGFQNPDLYPKMDLDTLFYIFYYHANTYEQYVRTPWRVRESRQLTSLSADGSPPGSSRSSRGGSTSST